MMTRPVVPALLVRVPFTVSDLPAPIVRTPPEFIVRLLADAGDDEASMSGSFRTSAIITFTAEPGTVAGDQLEAVPHEVPVLPVQVTVNAVVVTFAGFPVAVVARYFSLPDGPLYSTTITRYVVEALRPVTVTEEPVPLYTQYHPDDPICDPEPKATLAV